jgi:hypothetical protein
LQKLAHCVVLRAYSRLWNTRREGPAERYLWRAR